jgi:glutamine synthetase
MVEALITDCNGVARGKWLPKHILPSVMQAGLKMPKSALALDIWGCDVPTLAFENGDQDGYCTVVPGSLVPVVGEKGIDHAQLLLTMQTETGAPFLGDPRQVMQQVVNQFTSLGLRPVVAAELEFSLFPDIEGQSILKTVRETAGQNGNLYALYELDKHKAMLEAMRIYFEAQNLPFEGIIKEYAPAQYEVNMAYSDDAMLLADQVVCMQRGIRVVAKRFGHIASFMPKPMQDVAGNGMHVHCSLLDKNGHNVFNSGDDAGTDTLRHAVGGLLQIMSESMLVFAPSFNAYRRFQSGNHAPTFPAWGLDNRTTAIRIPAGPPAAKRVEHRVAGADANPYLTIAAILAGILHGIRHQIEPPAPLEGNAYEQQPDEALLPSLMGEAITAFSNSETLGELLDPMFQRMFSMTKQQELDVFQRRITEFELESYLRG